MIQTRVLFVQRALPHYRLPFFERLHRERDFSVTVAHGNINLLADLVGRKDVAFETVLLSNYIFAVPGLGSFVYQRGWSDLLEAGDYDCLVLEFNIRILSNYLLMQEAKRQRIPCILWGHGMGHSRLSLTKRLRYYLVQKCDALVTYTCGGSKPFLSQGIPPEKVFVAPNTLDVNHMRTVMAEERRNSILYVGRLIREKRVDVLIKAFASVTDQLPSSELIIIGDGPERQRLETLVAELSISSRCRFTGSILNENELGAFFSRAVAYVCPGYVGLGVVHSFAYGVPVIVQRDAKHSPEIEYVRHGENGLVLNECAPETFAAAIQAVFEDTRLQSRLRAGTELTAQVLSMDRMVQGFADAICYVCRGAGGEN